MIQRVNWISGSLVLAFAISSIGCGQGFQTLGAGGSSTNNSAGTPGSSAVVNDQVLKAQQATSNAQKAMADAQAAIAVISDANGGLNLGLLTGTTTAAATSVTPSSASAHGVLSPLIAKIQPLLNNIYTKALTAKQQFDLGRAALATALAQLSAADPAQAAQFAQLTAQMANIDKLEAQFNTAMQNLAGKVDLAIAAINGAVTSATGQIPGVGGLVGVVLDYFVMSDVINLLNSFKAELLAL